MIPFAQPVTSAPESWSPSESDELDDSKTSPITVSSVSVSPEDTWSWLVALGGADAASNVSSALAIGDGGRGTGCNRLRDVSSPPDH
jgi:hypothetical protein